MSDSTAQASGTSEGIEFYGADWCTDCRRSKKLLDELGVTYIYHDLESEDGAPERATAISGQKHIPVVQFADGTFQVEPSNAELRAKVVELGLYSE